MRLSILIVSYNEAEFLPECFESILRQKVNFDYEVIVGDDGSSDNSLEIIKSYAGKFKHFSYFVQDREPGLKREDVITSLRASNVLFRAMGMTQGKYINLLSGDDYFVDDCRFQRAVDFLDANKSYSAYLTSFYCVYPDGTKEFNDIRTFERFSFWYQQYIHCSCFVFRKLPKNLLLNSLCDDCGLQYSIALNGRLKYTNEHTFAYRQREKSIMHTHGREELDILEMLLFQEVLNKRLPSIKSLYAFLKLYVTTFRHFKYPFIALYKKQGVLDPQKYRKYISFSQNYKNDIVSALIYPQEKKNRRLLKRINRWIRIADVVLKKDSSIYTPVPPSDLPDFPTATKKIFYTIDLFKKTKKGIHVQGWAFVPDTECDIFIHANGADYRCLIYPRGDVKEAYGNTSINEGFFAVIGSDFEDFELCLVDRKKHCIYRKTVDNILTKYVPSEEISGIGISVDKKFRCTVDEKRYKHGKTYLRGWAFYENDDCEAIIEANGKFFTTLPVRRPDVMRVFALDDDRHGFTALLPFKASSFKIYLANHTKNEVYKATANGE